MDEHQTQRIPFSVIDEAIYLLDSETEPWSIQLELRVEGRLEEARLRRAIAAALSRHPMLRARKAPSPPLAARLTWEIIPEPDLDPLRVEECRDEHEEAARRGRLQSLRIPLAESPPLRLRLVHSPHGDLLMMNLKHVASDGYGGFRFLQSVARAYAGHDDPLPNIDFLETRDVESLLGAPDSATKRRRAWTLLEKLRDLAAPPAHIAGEGGGPDPGYGLHHERLSEEETRALLELAHPGTLNDLLLAALHLAIDGWNAARGSESRRIGVLLPVNLRPKEWWAEMAGNFTLMIRNATNPDDRSSPLAAVEAVTAQTEHMKRGGTAAALIELLTRTTWLPVWAKMGFPALLTLTGNRLVDSAQLSNLGELDDPPSFGPEAGETIEVWFSPPSRMPLGVTVGVATVARRLHLAFRYRRALFDEGAAASFGAHYRSLLRSFARELPARASASG